MAAIKEFIANLVEDLKASWRFKLALVLWIPLVVTTIVALVQFGAMNKAGDANTYAKTQIVMESTATFPMFYVFRVDGQPFLQSLRCINMNTGQLVQTQACANQYGPGNNAPTSVCTQVLANKQTATNSYAGRRLTCSVLFAFNGGNWPSNTVYQLTVVGADGIPDDNVWVNPTQNLSVAFQQQLTMASESANMDTSWGADIDYYSNVAVVSPSYTGSFTMEIRIDDFQNILYTQANTFTDYQFLAAWGGVMFFFYVLFIFVFSVAKFFLPDDSKLLRCNAGAASGPEYQTIK